MTDPDVISYLQLCQLSYQPPKVIPKAVAALPPLGPGGSWQCVWGPAHSPDQSNLAYVAAYYDSPGVPVFAAVAIRGTDIAVDAWGVIVQMWEDFDVLDPRRTWADKAAYDAMAKHLVARFEENFATFEGGVGDDVRAVAIRAAA